MPFLKVLFPNKEIKKYKIVHGMTIGRGRKNHLQIDEHSISRHHAQLVINSRNEVILMDLGSSNGVRVNGHRVSEQKLKHKDILALGATKMLFLEKTQGEFIDLAGIAPTKEDPKKNFAVDPEEPSTLYSLQKMLEEEDQEEEAPFSSTAVLKTERFAPKKKKEPEEFSFDIDALLESGDQELIDLFLDED